MIGHAVHSLTTVCIWQLGYLWHEIHLNICLKKIWYDKNNSISRLNEIFPM